MERLPKTSDSRRTAGYHQLLTSVDPYAPRGFQFKGQYLTPGASFDVLDLPRPAVMIESVGSVRIAPERLPRSFRHLYVLWRFDFDRREWIEVLRTYAEGSAWTLDLAPVAYRLLHPQPEAAAETAAAPLVDGIAGLLTDQLATMSRELRCYVLAGLDQWLANEIVKTMAALTVLRVGEGAEARYPRLGSHFGEEPAVRRPRTSFF